MEFSERIQIIKVELRNKGWKYADLADNSGIPLSTILKVLSGNTRSPRIDTVEAIERALGLNEKNPSNVYDVEGLLVYEEIGTICAGYNGMVNEIPTGKKIEIPASMISGGNKDDYFVLRVSGNSMYPKLLEGDTILCKRCDGVDSGDLAVILYNGDEATVKKVNYVTGQNIVFLVCMAHNWNTKNYHVVQPLIF